MDVTSQQTECREAKRRQPSSRKPNIEGIYKFISAIFQ